VCWVSVCFRTTRSCQKCNRQRTKDQIQHNENTNGWNECVVDPAKLRHRQHCHHILAEDERPYRVDAAPDDLDITFDVIGQFRGESDDPATILSDRQREAVETALDLGYYEQPREATHEDVAAKLDCAPQTASDHLQKAEAKLVLTALNDF